MIDLDHFKAKDEIKLQYGGVSMRSRIEYVSWLRLFLERYKNCDASISSDDKNMIFIIKALGREGI
ncbi:hypothetical protein GCM10007932_48430 [Vibrio penaeicida]|uniref:Integrase SAM-like N-terminal domain-containing protein n=1 Tax=Vibrio penaeicida TaxID=104609 RepID=A0AAV5NZQ6_9VIBR|nr:hypothetical protein GCM10007932_48430 [Vibrio penaeicida]